MTRRGHYPWLLALAALGLVACVIALIASHLAPLPGTGFEQRITRGMRCDGEPTTSIVREPYVPHLDDAPPRCIQWTASFVARTKMHARVEAMLAGAVSVSIDGRVVVSDEGATEARAKAGGAELLAGVHSFAASFRSRGGPAYLRISMDDELAPHDITIVTPIDDDAFYPTAAAAKAAFDAAAPQRSSWAALFAALALTGAGTCVWLAIRLRRGRVVPSVDLALATGLFAAAVFVRGHALGLQDVCWDEGIVGASEHYVRNAVLGDYFSEAWRHNLEHLPLSKWILALGQLLGGLGGARLVVAVMSSAAVAFLFAFGRVAFGRRVGVIAGALAVVLPLWVAHGRIAGHESFILFWWCGSMLALACWARSRDDTPGPQGDPLAAFMCVFAAVGGVFSRPTGIWIVPVLLGAWIVLTRGPFVHRLRAFPLAAIAGGLAGLGLSIAAWPLVWSNPGDKLTRISAHWTRPYGDIEVYMGKLCLPAWHYFVAAFLAETPALILAAAAAGIAIALRPGRARTWGIVCILWLVVPFGQSLSTLRIGAGRYVVQSWPALLLFAAVALAALGDALTSMAHPLPKSGRALVRASPAVLAFAYTYVALARVEPYPLDYFDELVGGPSGVAANHTFEVPWWGEGNLDAVRALNATAPTGALVRLALWPKHVVPRLRDDLIPVDDPALADYVVLSHLQYFEQPPVGCTLVSSVQVAGAPLVDTYHCTPASPMQLGFAEMHDPARVDQAIAHFQDALKLDPGDPGAIFGLGWAAQVKGDLRQAEMRYIAASLRAAQVHDPETQYFARYDLGTLYRQEGNVAQAIGAFRAALALRPNEASVVEALRALTLVPDAGRD